MQEDAAKNDEINGESRGAKKTYATPRFKGHPPLMSVSQWYYYYYYYYY